MTAKEWVDKYNVDLSKIHGNTGDYDGNILIETKEGGILERRMPRGGGTVIIIALLLLPFGIVSSAAGLSFKPKHRRR